MITNRVQRPRRTAALAADAVHRPTIILQSVTPEQQQRQKAIGDNESEALKKQRKRGFNFKQEPPPAHVK